MATGILGVAAQTAGIRSAALAAALVSAPTYGILGTLMLLRVLRHARAVIRDLAGPRSAGFAAVVAATCVLGAQADLAGAPAAARALWLAGAGLWCTVTFALLAVSVRRGRQGGLGTSPGGAPLLLVVATQAVVVLSTLTAASGRPAPQPAAPLAFGLGLFVLGGVLYGALIVPVARRLCDVRTRPREFAPSYWITMGALAISTLAASLLTGGAEHSATLHSLAPALDAGAVLCWIAATAWIPILAGRTIRWYAACRGRRLPMPEYWALVFPLGMYAAATRGVATAAGIPAIAALPPIFVGAGIAAWLLGMADLLRGAGERIGGRPTGSAA